MWSRATAAWLEVKKNKRSRLFFFTILLFLSHCVKVFTLLFKKTCPIRNIHESKNFAEMGNVESIVRNRLSIIELGEIYGAADW